MPKVRVEVSNDFTADEIMERTSDTLDNVMQAFQAKDLEVQTEGYQRTFKCSSFGLKFSGKAVVENNLVVVEIEMPFAAMMFKDKIDRAIRKNLSIALNGEGPKC